MSTTYTAINLATEISRCAAVSARHRANAATDPDADLRPLWMASADRHEARRRTLSAKARQVPCDDMRRALDLYSLASILD